MGDLTTLTDHHLRLLAATLGKTGAGSIKRLILMPLVVVAIAVVAAQCGLAALADIPTSAVAASQFLCVPDDKLPIFGMVVLGYLAWLGSRTWRSTMQRFAENGLLDA